MGWLGNDEVFFFFAELSRFVSKVGRHHHATHGMLCACVLHVVFVTHLPKIQRLFGLDRHEISNLCVPNDVNAFVRARARARTRGRRCQLTHVVTKRIGCQLIDREECSRERERKQKKMSAVVMSRESGWVLRMRWK